MSKTDKQNRLKSTVLAVAMAFSPLAAHAAGLGKLTVVSALGQPLRAEIEVTASREEYSSLTARLASAEAFRNAGIEYAPVLSTIRFSLDKRPNGQAFLRVSSDRPLNEPFVDMLVEVNWASGRLVREYTFLLDPPDVFQKPMAAPIPATVPEVRKEVVAPMAPVKEPEAATIAPRMPEPRASAPVDEKLLKKPVPVEAKPAKPVKRIAETPAEKAPEGSGTRVVKAGDTLAKIAAETKPEGVSLDQMLVALFRTNKDVFDAGNMNRLRAGKILSIPEKDVAAGVEQGEARKVIVAQAADFNAYRKKLAAVAATAPAREEAPKQVVTGKIAPKVEDKVPAPAAGKDKLEVSRSDAGKEGSKVGKGRAAIEEDLIARDKALKDANSRITELEKNLNDLKKLAELKSAAGAKVQSQAQAAKPAAETKTPSLPAVKPTEAPRTAEVAKPVDAEKPAEAAKPAEPAAKPPVPKKPVMPPPPPPEPPSFVEDNPGLVFGGGGVLALLLGYLGFNAWRKKKHASADTGSATDTAGASSVFATTGGESIDTGAAMPTDFSPDSVAGMAGDEGVDPVAEADVYIAYGRDRQAEEILLEALKTDPARKAIHLKLLEIYAVRKNPQRFEAVARDLQGLTGGSGEDWDKAVSLGLSIDPANSLYGGGVAVAALAPEDTAAEVSVVEVSEAPVAGGETVMMPAQMAATTAPAEEAAPEVTPEEIPASLDFDLDLGGPAPEAAAEATAEAPVAAASEDVVSLDFDLDLGAPTAEPAPVAEASPPAADEATALDFDLGTPVEEAAAPESPVAEAPAATESGEAAALDFDFDLGGSAVEAEEPAAPAAAAPAEIAAIDLSSISLDLGEPEAAAAPAEEAPVAEPAALSLDMPVVEVPEDLSLGVPVAAETAADLSLDMPSIDMTPAVSSEPSADEAASSLELPAIEVPAVEAPVAETDLELSFDAPAETAPPVAETPVEEEISFDLELPAVESAESPLEVAVPEAEAPSPVAEAAPAAFAVEDNAEAATKLELALAYEEMGDKEGARELLTEVINEGSPAQQEAARNKLATLD